MEYKFMYGWNTRPFRDSAFEIFLIFNIFVKLLKCFQQLEQTILTACRIYQMERKNDIS